MQSPSEAHMKAVIKILRYLKGTLGKGLLFPQNNYWLVEALVEAYILED